MKNKTPKQASKTTPKQTPKNSPKKLNTKAKKSAKTDMQAMNPRLFFIAFAIVIADLLTKFLVQTFITEGATIELLPILDLTYVVNRGAAFSMLAGLPYANYILMPIAFIATVAIGYWLYLHSHKETRINHYAFLCIMGGACGNLLDRIRFGYVIDFISVHYGDWYYPSFNVADSAITIGALLLIAGIFISPQPMPQQKKASRAGRGKS